MVVETVYYSLGSIFMGLGIVFLIALIIVIFIIKNKIIGIIKSLQDHIDELTDEAPRAAEIAMGLGAAFAKGLLKKMSKRNRKA